MSLKDWAETAAYIAASIGGPIAAVWALLQWRDSLKQRKREHRWRQADLGRQLLDQLFSDDSAGVALELIDGEIDTIDIPDGSPVVIGAEDIRQALTSTTSPDLKARQIRRHFDSLFYQLERYENMIRLELIDREDIRNPTQYYCRKLATFGPVINTYLREVGYTGALSLIKSLQSVE